MTNRGSLASSDSVAFELLSNKLFLSLLPGYDRSLPGFPRYTVLGSKTSGEFNLQISNATIGDDAIYECQVGPAPRNKPIRASARVSVLRKCIPKPCPPPLSRFDRRKGIAGQMKTKQKRRHEHRSCFSLCPIFHALPVLNLRDSPRSANGRY